MMERLPRVRPWKPPSRATNRVLPGSPRRTWALRASFRAHSLASLPEFEKKVACIPERQASRPADAVERSTRARSDATAGGVAEREGFAYELRELWSVPPTLTPPESPLVCALDRNIERVLGAPSRHVASPGTYDQKHVWRVGKLRDCVAYGPGILELAHQPNEYIDIDDMVVSAKVMAATALELLRGET